MVTKKIEQLVSAFKLAIWDSASLLEKKKDWGDINWKRLKNIASFKFTRLFQWEKISFFFLKLLYI